jgi:hypothetical protein
MATIIELSLIRGSLLATVPDCLTRFEAVLVNKPTGAPHVRQCRRPVGVIVGNFSQVWGW